MLNEPRINSRQPNDHVTTNREFSGVIEAARPVNPGRAYRWSAFRCCWVTTAIKVTEKHYSPCVRARQETRGGFPAELGTPLAERRSGCTTDK